VAGENEHEEFPDFEEDRELPAVQGASSTQLFIGSLFVLACLVAVWFLLFRPDRVAPKTITSPNPEVEYSANQGGIRPPAPVQVPAPRFPAPQAPVAEKPTPRATYDPKAAQREKERIEAELKRLQAQQKRMNERLVSKQLIIDNSASDLFGTANVTPAEATQTNSLSSILGSPTGSGFDGTASTASNDPNSQFFDSVTGGNIPTAKAVQLENLDKILPQGTVIKGVLETAVNSDLPGMMRAIATEHVYSFDGSEILIHKGSRLIGRYNSGVTAGQSRIFVIWERVIRPDGVSIKVDSPGTDELGTAGLGGDVDTHFFKRYGSAILLTVIEGSIDYAVAEAQNGNNTTVALGGAGDNVESLSNQALRRNLNIPPTIHVDQGTRINIFVSQDLSFAE